MTYHLGGTIHTSWSFESAVDRTKEALAGQGFGVLCEIDVGATLKAKTGVDVGKYLILGACNPAFAKDAVTAEPAIGVLLPCNVVLPDDGNGLVLEAVDPVEAMSVVGNPDLAGLASQVRSRLQNVIDEVTIGLSGRHPGQGFGETAKPEVLDAHLQEFGKRLSNLSERFRRTGTITAHRPGALEPAEPAELDKLGKDLKALNQTFSGIVSFLDDRARESYVERHKHG